MYPPCCHLIFYAAIITGFGSSCLRHSCSIVPDERILRFQQKSVIYKPCSAAYLPGFLPKGSEVRSKRNSTRKMNETAMLERTPSLKIDYQSGPLSRTGPLMHCHDSCELAFFERARVRIFLKDRQYEICDGDVLFIDEYEIHKIVYPAGGEYARFVINFRKSTVEQALIALGIPDALSDMCASAIRKVHLNRKQFEACKMLFAGLGGEKDRDRVTADDHWLTAEIKLRLIRALMALHEPYRQAAESTWPQSNPHARALLAYIDAHYRETINLDAVEKELGISRYHLCHLFKQFTGFTVMQYVQMKRVLEARLLLRDCEKKIIDISFECGFGSIQHFYRIFKKMAGCTPLEYRKTALPGSCVADNVHVPIYERAPVR